MASSVGRTQPDGIKAVLCQLPKSQSRPPHRIHRVTEVNRPLRQQPPRVSGRRSIQLLYQQLGRRDHHAVSCGVAALWAAVPYPVVTIEDLHDECEDLRPCLLELRDRAYEGVWVVGRDLLQLQVLTRCSFSQQWKQVSVSQFHGYAVRVQPITLCVLWEGVQRRQQLGDSDGSTEAGPLQRLKPVLINDMEGRAVVGEEDIDALGVVLADSTRQGDVLVVVLDVHTCTSIQQRLAGLGASLVCRSV
mmetsp:Transcript_13075/g.31242  ORF Transcript_13075/g.31242 Transcript_13075/m.31242 type:complete len:247 (+) Transcript_13075:199-939(+)